MARNRREETQAVHVFRDWRQEHPDAGIIVGTVRLDDVSECALVRIAHVDCCAVSLIAFAADLLMAASEALETTPFDESLHLLACVERARDALDLREPETIQ